MSITQVGSATNATGSLPTSITISKPSGGVTSGDVLIALITTNEDADPGTLSVPSGWVNICSATHSTPQHFGASWWYKVAGGSEPSNYTFNSVDADAPMVGTIVALRGVDTSSPVGDYSINQSNYNTTTINTPDFSDSIASGRTFFSRSVRTAGNNVATFSSATSGQSELDDVGAFSGGSTSYSHGIYWGTSDFTGGSHSPAHIAITSSVTSGSGNLTDVVMAGFTLKAAGAIASAGTPGGATATANQASILVQTVTRAEVSVSASSATVDVGGSPEVAELVAEAQEASRPMLPPDADGVATDAEDAYVHLDVNAGVASVSAAANDTSAYYGAATVRVYVIPAENRTYIVRR